MAISYSQDSVVKNCGADDQTRWLATILGRGDKSFTIIDIIFSVNVSAAFLQTLKQPGNHSLLGVFRMYISKIWCDNPSNKQNTSDPYSPSASYLYLFSIPLPQSSEQHAQLSPL